MTASRDFLFFKKGFLYVRSSVQYILKFGSIHSVNEVLLCRVMSWKNRYIWHWRLYTSQLELCYFAWILHSFSSKYLRRVETKWPKYPDLTRPMTIIPIGIWHTCTLAKDMLACVVSSKALHFLFEIASHSGRACSWQLSLLIRELLANGPWLFFCHFYNPDGNV